MHSVNHGRTKRKQLRAEAYEAQADAHRLLADAYVKLAEAEEIPDEDIVAAPAPGALVDKKTLARALALSTITVDRMVREGAPFEVVNYRKRFDLAKVKAWCASRGRKSSKAKRPDAEDSIDVVSVARSGGLRLIGRP